MDLFRITSAKYIRDLSGEGARKFGGRWNFKRIAMLYTSQSESLAVLETLVHVPISAIPNDLNLAVLKVPDELEPGKIETEELPENWRDYPAPHQLAKTGTDWINAETSLLLKVPSVLVNAEWNFLINPSHSDFNKIEIKDVRKFSFDSRLYS